MTSNDLMNTALKLARLKEIPCDSCISYKGSNIKRVLIGIDMETPELLLAKSLDYDCVVSHHPKADSSVIDFAEVMDVQIDRMIKSNVPINKAQKVLRKQQNKISPLRHASNYDRVSSAARLMKMPYMNIHIPADFITEKIVQDHLDESFKNNERKTLKDIINVLDAMPEYKNTLAKAKLSIGSLNDYAGKIDVLMAGGTNGGIDVIKSYFEAGTGTIICMHLPLDVKQAVIEQNIGNVIIAGHMPSDSIGLLKIVNEWRKQGLEVTTMSGIIEQ